jgi:hypothetical protein
MEREQLEAHKTTLAAYRSSLKAIIGSEPTGTPLFELAHATDAIAAVAQDLIADQLRAGEHAAAVSKMLKREGAPAVGLNSGYPYREPGSQVERSGPRVIKTGPVEADPRD